MRRLYPWLTAAGLIACVALAYLYSLQGTELVQLRADNLTLSASVKEKQLQIEDLEHKLATANTAAKRAELQLAAKNSPMPAISSGAKVIHMADIERDHPEFEALEQKQQRRAMLQQYGAALANFNLTPAQMARVKDLLVEKAMRRSDAQVAASDAGLKLGTQSYAEAMKLGFGDKDQQIDAIIGPGGQANLEESRMVAQTMTAVEQSFQPDFFDAGIPLTPEQAKSFAQLLYYEGQRSYYADQHVSTEVDPATWLSPANNLMLSNAASILTPAQLEVFKNHMSEEGQRQAIMALYRKDHAGPIIVGH